MRFAAAILMASLSILAVQPAAADSLQSRCSVAMKGDPEPAVRPCMFSQTQGNVYIRWLDEDEPFIALTGIEGVGMYVDGEGEPAYRRKGLGSDGQIYETRLGLVRVYWGS